MKTDLKTNIRTILARAYVRVIAGNREPSWVISETVLPLISTAAYVYVYKALNAPKEFTGFVILGGAMTAYWMNVLWHMAAQFYWEKEIGNLELYLIAPISRMSILLGMASGGFVYSTVRAISVFIAASLIFKVEFFLISFPKLILLFILTLIALYGLGMLFSSLFMLYGREAWHGVNLFQEPIYFLSGFYFPVRNLGFITALQCEPGDRDIGFTMCFLFDRCAFCPEIYGEFGQETGKADPEMAMSRFTVNGTRKTVNRKQY